MTGINISKPFLNTVMLIDDQSLYREMVADLIMKQKHLEVIAEMGFNEETFELALNLKPNLIIADPCLNHEDNIPFIYRLAQSLKKSHILLITSPCSSNFYLDFIKAGVAGIVLKTQNSSVLLKAIDRVLTYELWFDRTLLLSEDQEKVKPYQIVDNEEATLSSLSKRELEVVELVVNGHNTFSIANTLHISEKTVRNHIYSIYGKLEVKDRLELALYASRSGTLSIP